MKPLGLIFLCATVLALPSHTLAQIPNPGFETWTNGSPSGWLTNNIPLFDTTVTQTNSVHSGSSALMGTVKSFQGLTAYPPLIWTEFPVAQRYSTFTGWYTFSPVGGDSLFGWLAVYTSGTPLGYAFFSNKTTRGSYTQFSATIGYIQGGTPDSCQIWIGIVGSSANGDTVHVGSSFKLDDLALSGTAAGIAPSGSTPAAYALGQNFPNPFNPATVITYDLKAAGPVRLAVYDLLGREVAVLAEGTQGAGSHEVRFDGGDLASGVYIYRLQANGFVQQRKMILEK